MLFFCIKSNQTCYQPPHHPYVNLERSRTGRSASSPRFTAAANVNKPIAYAHHTPETPTKLAASIAKMCIEIHKINHLSFLSRSISHRSISNISPARQSTNHCHYTVYKYLPKVRYKQAALGITALFVPLV